MSDVSFTDFAYQAIEQAEQKRTHLMYLVIGCLLASLPGLAINGYFYQVAIHSKGGLSSGSLELIIILAMICLVLLAVGLQKFVLFRGLGNKLGRDSAIGCYLYILFIYATRGVAKWEKEVQSLDS